jgi:hypothetical protein
MEGNFFNDTHDPNFRQFGNNEKIWALHMSSIPPVEEKQEQGSLE